MSLQESIKEALEAGRRTRPTSGEKIARAAVSEDTTAALSKLAEALRDHRPPPLTLEVLSRVNQRRTRG